MFAPGGGADWRVCPFEPNRVWYSIKYTGSNDGEVLGRPATFKMVDSPVQAHSVTFNERGEVTKFTIGYVLDKETGNTGGLGGVFGLFCAPHGGSNLRRSCVPQLRAASIHAAQTPSATRFPSPRRNRTRPRRCTAPC